MNSKVRKYWISEDGQSELGSWDPETLDSEIYKELADQAGTREEIQNIYNGDVLEGKWIDGESVYTKEGRIPEFKDINNLNREKLEWGVEQTLKARDLEGSRWCYCVPPRDRQEFPGVIQIAVAVEGSRETLMLNIPADGKTYPVGLPDSLTDKDVAGIIEAMNLRRGIGIVEAVKIENTNI